MRCPYCGNPDTRVIDSRPAEDKSSIRRRRSCDEGGKRFTTYEKIEHISLVVVKKDGTREQFDREKLLGGLLRACQKRPVSIEQLEILVDDVETILSNSLEREVTSHHIGELVMAKLKDIDEVSYVRFASVYRQFKDINTFMEELKKLLSR